MGDRSKHLILLASGLDPFARGLGERLARLGWASTLLLDCVPPGPPATCPGVVVRPGLGHPWRRFWAVRGILGDAELARPELLMVLGASMAETGLVLADRWQVPYVLAVDEFLPPGARLRLSRRWCRSILATSIELARDLVESAGVPRRAVVVVRPGVEAEGPCDRQAAPVPPGSARVPVVGTAGPLASGSGIVTFLQAAHLLVAQGLDAEFVIAGRGPNEEPLRRLAARLGVADRVTFADDAAAHASFWRVLDVFALTAVEPTTAAPLARALAHAVPAIATDAHGFDGLLIDGETGLRVPQGDADALADAVRALLSDVPRAQALGRAGHARIVRDFDPARQAAELDAALVRALESDSGCLGRPRAVRADAGSAAVG